MIVARAARDALEPGLELAVGVEGVRVVRLQRPRRKTRVGLIAPRTAAERSTRPVRLRGEVRERVLGPPEVAHEPELGREGGRLRPSLAPERRGDVLRLAP